MRRPWDEGAAAVLLDPMLLGTLAEARFSLELARSRVSVMKSADHALVGESR